MKDKESKSKSMESTKDNGTKASNMEKGGCNIKTAIFTTEIGAKAEGRVKEYIKKMLVQPITKKKAHASIPT